VQEFNLSNLILPITLYGFNNQVNTLYHAIVLSEFLNKTIIEPVFFTHYTCAKNASKQVWQFNEALQWTSAYKRRIEARDAPVEFSIFKKWIACKNLTKIEVIGVRESKTGAKVFKKQLERISKILGVQLVMSEVVSVSKRHAEYLQSSEENLAKFFQNTLLYNSEKLIVSAIFQMFPDLTKYSPKSLPVMRMATHSLFPADRFISEARLQVLNHGVELEKSCAVHFRPYTDGCAKRWLVENSTSCENSDQLWILLGLGNQSPDCTFMVFYPPFLSPSGLKQVHETFHPRINSTTIAQSLKGRECFELSLIEQTIAVISPRFNGSSVSTWATSVELFRECRGDVLR
jgi:hypothetical protein